MQTVVADVNGDGRPDLVTVSNYDSATGVLLGLGGGTFEPAPAGSGVGVSDTPFLADLTGNGIQDSVVLDRSGNILYRAGLPGEPGTFAPPVILNPGRPARAITLVRIGSRYGHRRRRRPRRAHGSRPASSSSPSRSTRSAPAATVIPPDRLLDAPALPTSLAAADLTGNGLDDLIAANALNDSVTIALQTAPGTVRGADHGARRDRAVRHRGGRPQRRRPAGHRRHRPGLGRGDRPAQRPQHIASPSP